MLASKLHPACRKVNATTHRKVLNAASLEKITWSVSATRTKRSRQPKEAVFASGLKRKREQSHQDGKGFSCKHYSCVRHLFGAEGC